MSWEDLCWAFGEQRYPKMERTKANRCSFELQQTRPLE
jgi:hypothetical protein